LKSSNDPDAKAGVLLPFSRPKGLIVMPPEITDLDLQALVDDELGPEEARAVMTAVLKIPALLERLDELIQQKNLIRAAWPAGKDIAEH